MAKVKRIEIKPVKIEVLPITIEGDTSLLCNKFSGEKKDEILAKQTGEQAQRAPKDPEHDYNLAYYQANAGWYGFAAEGIKASCVGACRFIDTLPMTQARGAFYVLGEEGTDRDAYEKDTRQWLCMLIGDPEIRMDRVSLRGVADIRFRAEFFPWRLTFRARYNPNVITPDAIVNIVQLAGFHQGLGDWRPANGGTNGMFHVVGDE